MIWCEDTDWHTNVIWFQYESQEQSPLDLVLNLVGAVLCARLSTRVIVDCTLWASNVPFVVWF